jgi:hypothetical protein
VLLSRLILDSYSQGGRVAPGGHADLVDRAEDRWGCAVDRPAYEVVRSVAAVDPGESAWIKVCAYFPYLAKI